MNESEPRSRYEHSLLDLCGNIHGAYTGSGDGFPKDEMVRLHAWLSWRIAEGWNRTESDHLRLWFFEEGVHLLCRAALDELSAMIESDDW